LVILQPAASLRQVGYEAGDAICRHGGVRMNQSFVQAVPFNRDATEWTDVNHFGLHEEAAARLGGGGAHRGSHVAAMRYRFNATRGLYEWVDVGPLLGPALFEGNISPHGQDWVIAARRES